MAAGTKAGALYIEMGMNIARMQKDMSKMQGNINRFSKKASKSYRWIMPKGNTIQRAFKIIKMFESGPVTVHKLKTEFGISKQAAQHYIDQASLCLPIYESGFDSGRLGRPGIVYEMANGGAKRAQRLVGGIG